MSESEFISSLENLGLSISDEQINKFRVYARELLSYNEHTNLTAIRNIEEVYLKHFYDSLTIYRFIGLVMKVCLILVLVLDFRELF